MPYAGDAAPGLLLGKTGGIYGFLGAGIYKAGAIAQLFPAPDGWSYTQMYSFCSLPRCADGDEPPAPLTWDTRGNLYGVTEIGGIGYGVAFELARKPAYMNAAELWTYHVIHTFGGTNDGQRPVGGVAVDKFGNVYGTTGYGGAYDNGTVFELTPLAGSTGLWEETILYDFPNLEQAFPYGNLLLDPAGNLYGINAGGADGTIFKLSRQENGNWVYSVVHSFDGADGNHPEGITTDGKGNLFGTTMTGGTYDRGVVFEITP